ncbi:MAG TPA: pyridoxamine 5'-phosphate oxidase family protein [Vicinamibacterales bacterium]
MVIHELPESECRDLLRRNHVARLACVRKDQPYVVPIQFDFDGEHLYFFATLGQKIIWMRENPHVCVEVEEIRDKYNWATVLVFGRYEELRDQAHEEARTKAMALFGRRSAWWLPGAARVGAAEHHVPVLFRVRPSRLTGRRASRD